MANWGNARPRGRITLPVSGRNNAGKKSAGISATQSIIRIDDRCNDSEGFYGTVDK